MPKLIDLFSANSQPCLGCSGFGYSVGKPVCGLCSGSGKELAGKNMKKAVETTLSEVRAWAEKYDERLLATDPRFGRAVYFVHRDQTAMFLTHAFLVHVGGTPFYACFSEHHGFKVLHADDIRFVQEFRPSKDIERVSVSDVVGI